MYSLYYCGRAGRGGRQGNRREKEGGEAAAGDKRKEAEEETEDFVGGGGRNELVICPSIMVLPCTLNTYTHEAKYSLHGRRRR